MKMLCTSYPLFSTVKVAFWGLYFVNYDQIYTKWSLKRLKSHIFQLMNDFLILILIERFLLEIGVYWNCHHSLSTVAVYVSGHKTEGH